jgi:catechol 2,3-dioxygenase-like lactoylglutathione lyase family enzyme
MSVHFTHVTFTVSNFERSIAFYRDVCELKVVRDRRLEGGSTVWLGPQATAGEIPPFVFVIEEGDVTSRLDHLAFQ